MNVGDRFEYRIDEQGMYDEEVNTSKMLSKEQEDEECDATKMIREPNDDNKVEFHSLCCEQSKNNTIILLFQIL